MAGLRSHGAALEGGAVRFMTGTLLDYGSVAAMRIDGWIVSLYTRRLLLEWLCGDGVFPICAL